MQFKEVDIEQIQMNPFTLIGKEWMLVTAGDSEQFNTMTASWGGIGIFWGKNATTLYIRPQRYTREFIEKNDTFTISFFEEDYKKALAYCGKYSGRDVDKVKETGLTPVFTDGTTYFEEAKMVLVCKKLYHTDMKDGTFDAPEYIDTVYPGNDYHIMYVGEIIKTLVKE